MADRERIEASQRYNCRFKVKHDTVASAFAAIDTARLQGALEPTAHVGIYLCCACKKYHWGHRKGEGHKLRERHRKARTVRQRIEMEQREAERKRRKEESSCRRRANLINEYLARGEELPSWLCSDS